MRASVSSNLVLAFDDRRAIWQLLPAAAPNVALRYLLD
ncbi:hypothetical protein BZL29_7836 [Mycobacterium kansasii]|uniref:Uncharacterized protein n=1 Tax=Mycobacterium kansasii TaxID=1768 RepID=A0A1V3WGK5_MYCKA|nr:hypothetical protein BZL29_7836 [Mycobacterium kansasii]